VGEWVFYEFYQFTILPMIRVNVSENQTKREGDLN
jgi:hypothetical protein